MPVVSAVPSTEEQRSPTFRRAIMAQPGVILAFGGIDFHVGGNIPMLINGRIPFWVHFGEGGRLICDVQIYSIGTKQIISIGNNTVDPLPDGWDTNSNDNGMEIVNEDQQPVFQMYYESPTVIRIQGIVVVPPVVILAKGDLTRQIGFNSPALPDAIRSFSLPRFFKYPSALFPGVPN
jgi:hypothetical protein